MIISLPDDQNSFMGWVECQSGFHSFSVSLISEIGSKYGHVDMRSLVVDDELGALLRPMIGKRWFRDKLESCKSSKALAIAIQNSINLRCSEQAEGSYQESSLPQLLIRHLDEVGWDRILKVNEDLTSIQMRATDYTGREHTFDVIINPGYPNISPTVQATLPVQIEIPWNRNSDLKLVVSIVDAEIKTYEKLFQELTEIDTETWVLEPAQPNFSTTSRRLAIERSCSIVLDINVENPRDICPMNFFGPPSRVNSFRASLNRNLHLWSKDRSVKKNIEIVVGFHLPSRITQGSAAENLCEECGICYTYSIPSAKSDIPGGLTTVNNRNVQTNFSSFNLPIIAPSFSVPDQACSNTKCCKMYHFSCFVDWLQSLPSSKTSFGTLFGNCPYCQEAMSVRIQR